MHDAGHFWSGDVRNDSIDSLRQVEFILEG